MTGSQSALVKFLRIDGDLVDVAAAGSPQPREQIDEVERWVAGLAEIERGALLVGLLRRDDPFLRGESLRRARPSRCERAGVRTTGQLLDTATTRREERERIERERRESRSTEQARRTEVARRERLAGLVAEGEAAWARVAARIAEKKPSGYDVAVDLLVDLREVSDPTDFASRLDRLRREHGRKVTFVERLAYAGL